MESEEVAMAMVCVLSTERGKRRLGKGARKGCVGKNDKDEKLEMAPILYCQNPSAFFFTISVVFLLFFLFSFYYG